LWSSSLGCLGTRVGGGYMAGISRSNSKWHIGSSGSAQSASGQCTACLHSLLQMSLRLMPARPPVMRPAGLNSWL
jgi:hypothetical protein